MSAQSILSIATSVLAEPGPGAEAFVAAPSIQPALHVHSLRGRASAGAEAPSGGWSLPAVGAVVAAATAVSGSRRRRSGAALAGASASSARTTPVAAQKPPLHDARVIVCAGSKLPEGRKLRVAVVGGGPGGACCADTLARAGIETYLIERKLDNCKPCGGAIPLCMIDEFDLPEGIIDRQVRKMTMISPTNKEVQIGQTLKDNEFIGMLRREVLDSFLRNRAAENGATVINGLFMGMTLPKGKEDPYVLTYNDFSDQDGNARQGTKKTMEVDVVIGADGANSRAEGSAAVIQVKLPLSDKALDLKSVNTILSSAQSREKALKIIQYSAKLAAYALARAASDLVLLSKHCDALAKSLSTARRFFKFMRWIKHFEDLADARAEKSAAVSKLLYLDIACNVAADISEDVTSLEKVGVLRKGVLPARTEYYANWCQLVLAVVEIAVSYVKERRAAEKAGKPDAPLEVRRKHAMAKIEFSKFIADLIKAFWDCELSFASELAFCVSGLWAALASTHKYALRALK